MTIEFGSPEAQAILAKDKAANLKPTTIELMLCCNDDRNGMNTGHADGIDLCDNGDIMMALRGTPRVCRLVGNVLTIGRIKVTAITYQTWVGNWSWDCARVTLEDAARVVNYLRMCGWDCEMGYEALADLYEDAWESIAAEDLAEIMR